MKINWSRIEKLNKIFYSYPMLIVAILGLTMSIVMIINPFNEQKGWAIFFTINNSIYLIRFIPKIINDTKEIKRILRRKNGQR